MQTSPDDGEATVAEVARVVRDVSDCIDLELPRWVKAGGPDALRLVHDVRARLEQALALMTESTQRDSQAAQAAIDSVIEVMTLACNPRTLMELLGRYRLH